MTLQEQLDYIKDTLENPVTGLPPLLLAAGLPQFVTYSSHDTEELNTIEIGVYTDVVKDTTDNAMIAYIIKIQMYAEDLGVQYYDVINPFIRKNIKAGDLGYTNRDSLIADFWPLDQRSTSYVYFSLVFSSELDDCS
jgi:hypothetical protein